MLIIFVLNVCKQQLNNNSEPVKVWHGEADIALFDFVGGYREAQGPRDAMFDNQYGWGHLYHSVTCGNRNEERGIDITFLSSMVQYVDLEIHTRRDCCADRYRNVCLYIIDVYGGKYQLACTPPNLGDLGPKGTLKMKDFNLNPTEVFGTQFQLRFEDYSYGDNGCGRTIEELIEELYFHYKETPGNKIGVKSVFKD